MSSTKNLLGIAEFAVPTLARLMIMLFIDQVCIIFKMSLFQ